VEEPVQSPSGSVAGAVLSPHVERSPSPPGSVPHAAAALPPNVHATLEHREAAMPRRIFYGFKGLAATRPECPEQLDQRPKTRLQSRIRKEKVYTDGTIKYGCFTSTGEANNIVEPLDDKNLKGAMEV
jgi:hypothetical protein